MDVADKDMDVADKDLEEVRYRIIAEGPAVSAEEVAGHFPGREALNAAIVGEAFELVQEHLEALPAPEDGDDVGTWIDEVTAAVHHGAIEIFGEMFWDMRLSSTVATGGRIGDLAVDRRFVRDRWSKVMAESAWRASGQRGDAPAALARAFDAHLNLFAVHAQLSLGRSTDEGAAVSAELLKLVLAGLTSGEEGA